MLIDFVYLKLYFVDETTPAVSECQLNAIPVSYSPQGHEQIERKSSTGSLDTLTTIAITAAVTSTSSAKYVPCYVLPVMLMMMMAMMLMMGVMMMIMIKMMP